MFRKPIFWILIVALLVGAGGGGYYYYTRTQVKTTAAATQTLKTSQVSRGNLVISASGTGTLVSASVIDLAFSKSGTLAQVNVQVGDRVKVGDALAKQGNLESLQASVASDQLSVLTAQQALDDLNKNLATNRADAQVALVTAQKSLADAKYNYNIYANYRCDASSIQLYYGNLLLAENKVKDLQDKFNNNFASLPQDDVRRVNAYANLYSAIQDRDTALRTYNFCTGNADAWTLSDYQAAVNQAQATLDAAQAKVNALKSGPDATEVALAKGKLDSAKAQLAVSQKALSDASLVSPVEGVVTAVNYQVGEVTSGTFITIADTLHPKIQFYMDETDLDKVTKGLDVQVVFDALPTKTFTGKVTQIDPALATVSGVGYIRGLVTLDDTSATTVSSLPTGMNAAVEVIGGKATNALLIPIEALRTLGSDEYGVFVQGNDGRLRLTKVTIGLKSLTQVEIKSGLQLGEIVSTGISGTASSTASTSVKQ